MNPDEQATADFHNRVIVQIASDHPSRTVWQFQAFNLTNEELHDMAALIRQVVENFRPKMEES